MTLAALLGGGIGALGGLGLALLVAGAPLLRRPDLHARLAPHLRDAPRASRLLAAEPPRGPLAALPAVLVPVVHDVARAAGRMLVAVSGSGAGVRRRLEHAGSRASVEQFRAEQVLCGAGGLALGLVVALVLAATRPAALVPGLLSVGLGAVGGVIARDQLLTRAVRRRSARLAAELPTVAELLALSVSAGEGALGALERLARSTSGELAGELRRTLADSRSGAGLVVALQHLAARAPLPGLVRFVDGVVVAVERGTPLAEVLRAQAQDAREAGRRDLLEAGGRKEVAMMVPVVFLVLPVTVLFAVFPGIAVLRLSP